MTSQEFKRLFDPGDRLDSRPSRNDESMYEFYDRIGPSPLWDEVRALLNEWLQEHPDAGKLLGRLKNKKEFHPAFWELYVHEVFRRLGYQAEVERAITKNRPDYFCTKGDTKLVVECWSSASAGLDRVLTLVGGKLEYVPYDEKSIRVLQEVLNDRIVSSSLAVSLEDVDARGERPGWKKICGPVQRWIDGNPAVGDQKQFNAEGWLYTLSAWPQPHSEDPFVAAFPMGSMDPTRPIKKLLKGIRDKARKEYLHHDEERLVIAANFPSTLLKSEEVEAALCQRGGLWSNGNYRHVDGVLIGKFIKPYSVATSLPTLWLNPDTREIDLPFDTVRPASSGLVRVEGTVTAREFFNLPVEWGTAAPFPSADCSKASSGLSL